MSGDTIGGNSLFADGFDDDSVRITTGTDYLYNGVLMRRALTNSVERRIVPDSTGVNYMYVETVINITVSLFDITFSNDLGADEPPLPDVEHGINDHVPDFQDGADAGGLHSLYRYVAQRLNTPRRRFVWQIGEQPIMDVRPVAVEFGVPQTDVGGTDPLRTSSHANLLTSGFAPVQSVNKGIDGTDINNGPKCEHRIEKIVGGASMQLEVTFTLCTPLCTDFVPSMSELNGPNNLGKGLISFRFWIDEDLDGDTWLTTRIYRGRIRVASSNQNLHWMVRNLIIIPPLQPGFKRGKISYSENPNGLELDYIIPDQEVMNAPPCPAVHWEGQHSLQTALIQKKPIATSELNFQLTAPLSVSQRALLELGVRIIDAKTHILSRYNAGGFNYKAYNQLNTTVILVGLSVTAPLTGSNTVAFSAQFMHPLTGAGTASKASSDEEGVNNNLRQNSFLNLMSAIGFGRSLEYTNAFDDDPSPMGVYNPATNDYDRPYSATSFPELRLRVNNADRGIKVQTATLAGLFLSVIHDPCRPPVMPQGRGAAVPSADLGEEATIEAPGKPDASDGTEEEPNVTEENHPLNAYPARIRNSSAYINYEVENDYECVQPKIALPVGHDTTTATPQNPNPTYKMVNIFGERVKRHIRIKATRINQPPELVMAQEFTDVNGILNTPTGEVVVSPIAASPAADGIGMVYEMEQVITFAMDRPAAPTDVLQMGKVQYLSRTTRGQLDTLFSHGEIMLPPTQTRSPV